MSPERVGLLFKKTTASYLEAGMSGGVDDPASQTAIRRLRLGIQSPTSTSRSSGVAAASDSAGAEVSIASTGNNTQYLLDLACGVNGVDCSQFSSLLSAALLPERYSSSNPNDTAGALLTSPVKDQKVRWMDERGLRVYGVTWEGHMVVSIA